MRTDEVTQSSIKLIESVGQVQELMTELGEHAHLMLNLERMVHATFAEHHANPEYRPVLAYCYQSWQRYNSTFFEAQLQPPHIAIGRTAPRSLMEFSSISGNGGVVQMMINQRLISGEHSIVVQPYPASGFPEFLADLVLHGTVRQSVLELDHKDEARGHRGTGPLFCQQANRISTRLNLPHVQPRERTKGAQLPPARHWPMNVRAEEHYLPAIDYSPTAHGSRQVHGRHQGMMAYFYTLLQTGRAANLEQLLARILNRSQDKTKRAPLRIERGEVDEAGNPIGDIRIQPEWLLWNDRCIPKLAHSIVRQRAYEYLPILGDALRDSGCTVPELLQHCQLDLMHSQSCFVLRLILQGVRILQLNQ